MNEEIIIVDIVEDIINLYGRKRTACTNTKMR